MIGLLAAVAVALVPLAVVRLLEGRDRRRREAGALRREP
jgi:hypothetical protein